MEINKSELERAFEIARSGKWADVASIQRQLKDEGYSGNYIEGKSLKTQLLLLIESSKRQV